MRVYGDRPRRADPRTERAALRTEVEAAAILPAGLARHAALVTAMIVAGELAQGLADEAFARTGQDGPSPAADDALEATRALAAAVWASWRGDFGVGPLDTHALDALQRHDLPPEVILKEGEGYAFYALYPETYGEAAAGLAPGPTTVVGLRSIGTSLAAMVAAVAGAETLITVRPTGPPFRRRLRLSREFKAVLRTPGRRVAVADEGPGLSGSSFGAVLDLLEAEGTAATATVFPSHPGDPGPEADPAHRARWATIPRRVVSFEDAIASRLPSWVEDLTGPATEPTIDLSGGAWRTVRYRGEADWPAVNAGQERRKFLIRTDAGAVLLKFAGLGRIGARKLARAQALAAAGFTPAPLGLRHGFLVEHWEEGAPSAAPPLATLAAYLGFRAKAFPAGPEEGASLADLLDMARVNAREALGEGAAQALEAWVPALPRLEARVRRVATDNRLHAHEWITGPNGRWLKTDAVDHAEAHDLIGAQDVAWDVAGAGIEFDLDPDAVAWLAREAGADLELTRFCGTAYPAFQLGHYAMAVDVHGGWQEEAARLAAARDRYADRLRRILSA